MITTYQRLKRRRGAGEIDGFTLIELLIVIVVLGILAAVVIFALGGITGKSNVAACQSDGATVSTALAAFKAENPSVTASETLMYGTTGAAATDGGPYIQAWPSAQDYAFQLTAPGVLQVAPTTNGAAVSLMSSTWVDYVGPLSCSNSSSDTPAGIGLGS